MTGSWLVFLTWFLYAARTEAYLNQPISRFINEAPQRTSIREVTMISSKQLGRTSSPSSSSLHMATWSNSQAVQDYQNFLQSGQQQVNLAKDGPSVIIQPKDGPTDWTRAMANMGTGQDLILTPDQDLPDSIGGNGCREYPIYITLPPYQLESFLQDLRDSYKARPEDFVFLSGGLRCGNIEDLLKDRGYCRDSMTQVLVSGMRILPNYRVDDISVKLGLNANGEQKWAGECASCGKWAGAVAERLERNNIQCRVDFYREWRRRMWEQSAADAMMHLIGVVRPEVTTISDVANYYAEEFSDMAWEFSQLLRGWKAITLLYGFEERMLGFAASSGSLERCTLIEEMYPFIWGNYVYLQSKMFVGYLTYAQQEMGLLKGIDLPQKSDEDFSSNMRQGNLRADGVV